VKLEDLQVEIRPRTAGQTVAIAARVLQHRPGPILGAWAFYTTFVLLLSYLLFAVLELHPAWVWLVVPLLAPLFSPPLVTTIGHLVFTPQVTFGTVAAQTLRRFFPFALLFLVNRVLVLVGLCLLVVPGLFLWRSSWFLGPIALLEGSPLGASFRRGRRFASGFHGHVVGHAVSAALLLGYLTGAVFSLLHFLNTKIFGLSFAALTQLTLFEEYYHWLGLAAFAVVAPFITLVWFFVYLDVRTRKEGWDLEIAFRAQAARLAMTERSGSPS
jgi:hypothetical protein